LAPSNYRTNAHLEDLGYLPPRRSAFNRFNRTLTQVRGIRPRHRFSSPANQFPQIRLDDSGWESLRFNADGKCSRCRELFGPSVETMDDSDGGTAYKTKGDLAQWMSEMMKGTDYYYLAAEFGTYSVIRVLAALRRENQAYFYARDNRPVYKAAQAELLECF